MEFDIEKRVRTSKELKQVSQMVQVSSIGCYQRLFRSRNRPAIVHFDNERRQMKSVRPQDANHAERTPSWVFV